MEMTGLNPQSDTILEVAILITDTSPQLRNMTAGLTLFVAPENILHDTKMEERRQLLLSSMNEWCRTHHTESGLIDRVLEEGISIHEAQKQILAYLNRHLPNQQQTVHLCGNTIYMDRQFIARWMPEVDRMFHYRLIDVSTVKELCRRWNPKAFEEAPVKRGLHRALDDIQESINELRHYSTSFLNIQQ
jgi:oligoribonuclease